MYKESPPLAAISISTTNPSSLPIDLTIPILKKSYKGEGASPSANTPTTSPPPSPSRNKEMNGAVTSENKKEEDDEEENLPQWAMDSMGFFLTKGTEKYDHNYPAENHRLSKETMTKVNTSASQEKNSNTTTTTTTTTQKNILLLAPKEKCDTIHQDLRERLEWWKLRAKELDPKKKSNTNSTTDTNNNNNISEQQQQQQLSSWKRLLLHEIRVYIRQNGLTMAERSVAWPLIAGMEYDRTARLERCMHTLIQIPLDPEVKDVMLRDLGRTLPTHSMFRGLDSIGQRRLERILTCYANMDESVQYVQGMGFIVGILLLHMSEVDAFGLFVQMMHGRRYMMRGLYQSGFPLMQRMLDVFRKVLRLMLPQLMDHFDALCIDPAFFASHWFLTLFAYQFSVPLVCRIWDLFLSEGWIWIFRVAVALLAAEQKKLCQMPMEEILLQVKLIHEGKSEEEILRLAKDVSIRESDLVTIEEDGIFGGGGENNDENDNETHQHHHHHHGGDNKEPALSESVVGRQHGENLTRRFP